MTIPIDSLAYLGYYNYTPEGEAPMIKTPRSVLTYSLRQGFAEWLEGDSDVSELLMDKLAEYMELNAAFLDEDARYDIGLEVISDIGIR